MLTVGSLFSGIGGLDLGLERAGMQVIWQSEIDDYASRLLKKHWPEVPNYGDIKRINWGDLVRPDVICGGYPCQPFSAAGKRKGEEDPRHLWPWVRQAISELRPRYAILENVRGHLSLGGTTVIGEITALGYDAEWRIVSAASVGANHRRDRIFIVAYPNRGDTTNGRQRETLPSEDRCWGDDTRGSRSNTWKTSMGSSGQNTGNVANASSDVPDPYGEWGRGLRSLSTSRESVFSRNNIVRGKEGFTSRTWWEVEPNVGRVANGVPSRVDRLRGLGNAVVPQVAEIIGRLVVAHAEHN